MGLIVIAMVIRFEYKGTSKSIKRVDLHKFTQNPYKSESFVFWIHDSRFEIPDSRFKDCARSLGGFIQIKKLGHSVPQCITVFHSVIRSLNTRSCSQ